MKKSSIGYLKDKGFTLHYFKRFTQFKKTFAVNSAGFTLIELMIVLSLMGLMSVVAIASFVSFNRSQTLQAGVNDFITAVKFAKASAASQVKPNTSPTACITDSSLISYQVTIDTNDTYKVVAVCTDGVSIVSSYSLPKDITFSAGDVSKNISFSLLRGGASGLNQVTINGYSKAKIINIDKIGKITVQ